MKCIKCGRKIEKSYGSPFLFGNYCQYCDALLEKESKQRLIEHIRNVTLKDVFTSLIEYAKAVQEAGYDGIGVDDLKDRAKLLYDIEV